MSLFPVIVVFGLSFPPIFFELLLSLAIFWLVRKVLVPTGIYDFVWHPALFEQCRVPDEIIDPGRDQHLAHQPEDRQ